MNWQYDRDYVNDCYWSPELEAMKAAAAASKKATKAGDEGSSAAPKKAMKAMKASIRLWHEGCFSSSSEDDSQDELDSIFDEASSVSAAPKEAAKFEGDEASSSAAVYISAPKKAKKASETEYEKQASALGITARVSVPKPASAAAMKAAVPQTPRRP